MRVADRDGSNLTVFFREFYHEVIHQKRLIQAGFDQTEFESHSPEENNEEGTGEDKTENIDRIVWRKLLTLLEKQDAEIRRMVGGYALEIYKEAQFIMAALADEIFLHMEWSGKNAWQENLLETKLFGSHSAGEIFFEKLDHLLQNRDPIYRDLAKVFFMALALGFQGKHRGELEGDWLDFYQKSLFRFIYQKEPEFSKESKHFFDQAYSYMMHEKSGLKLPNPRKWVFILIFWQLILFSASYFIYTGLIEDLEQNLNQILLEGS